MVIFEPKCHKNGDFMVTFFFAFFASFSLRRIFFAQNAKKIFFAKNLQCIDMSMVYKLMQKKSKDLFFVGKGKCKQTDNKCEQKCTEDDNMGHDFALLVQSSHTITSEGSFSLWASVINKGRKYGVGKLLSNILNYSEI